jgi:hypothetical protein
MYEAEFKETDRTIMSRLRDISTSPGFCQLKGSVGHCLRSRVTNKGLKKKPAPAGFNFIQFSFRSSCAYVSSLFYSDVVHETFSFFLFDRV